MPDSTTKGNALRKASLPFAMIALEVLNDRNITAKAKGIYAYLYGKPEGWNFSYRRIASDFKDGRDGIQSGLQELEDAGYLRRERRNTGRVEYILTHTVTEKGAKVTPKPENPARAQVAENPPQKSKASNVQKSQQKAKAGNSLSRKSRLINKKEVKIDREKELINNTKAKAFEAKTPDEVEAVELVATPYEEKTNPPETQTTHGNEDINWVIAEFERIRGFKSQGTGQKDRWMAKHLLNNFNRQEITAMLIFCEQDIYSPRVGSVADLWHNRGKIIAGLKKTVQVGKNVTKIS